MAAFPLCFPHGLSLGCVCIGVGGGKERDRKGGGDRAREKEGQRDGETERGGETEREMERQRERWRDSEMERQTERQRWREGETDRQRERGRGSLLSLLIKTLLLGVPCPVVRIWHFHCREPRDMTKKKKKDHYSYRSKAHPCDLTSP